MGTLTLSRGSARSVRDVSERWLGLTGYGRRVSGRVVSGMGDGALAVFAFLVYDRHGPCVYL